MSPSLIICVALGLLLILIALRAPIFVALGLAGLVGLFMSQGVIGLRQAPIAVIAQLQTYSLVAAPMYILMGEILAVSGLGRDIFAAAQRWFSRIRGRARRVRSGCVHRVRGDVGRQHRVGRRRGPHGGP